MDILIHIATRATETKREKVETHQTKSRQFQHRITEVNGNSNKRDMAVMIMDWWIRGFVSLRGSYRLSRIFLSHLWRHLWLLFLLCILIDFNEENKSCLISSQWIILCLSVRIFRCGIHMTFSHFLIYNCFLGWIMWCLTYQCQLVLAWLMVEPDWWGCSTCGSCTILRHCWLIFQGVHFDACISKILVFISFTVEVFKIENET